MVLKKAVVDSVDDDADGTKAWTRLAVHVQGLWGVAERVCDGLHKFATGQLLRGASVVGIKDLVQQLSQWSHFIGLN
jgi:hypothetical protein